MTTEPRIYVACLASYNAGRLHGVWIDCEGKTVDEIQDEVNVMLRASPWPNVMRADYVCECGERFTLTQGLTGPLAPVIDCASCDGAAAMDGEPYASAEEWAIHDHEGLGDLIGEYSSFETVAAVSEVMADDDDDKRRGLLWLVNDRGYKLADALEKCDDVRTSTETPEEYAESFVSDCYGQNELGPLAAYIDYERYARDLVLGGDIDEATEDGERFLVVNASEF